MRQLIEIKPSRYLAAILAVAHCAALASLIPLTFPAWAKAALGLVILFSLLYHVLRDAWLSAPFSGRVLALKNDEVVLTTNGGAHLAVRISRDSVATPFLTVINVVPRGAFLARSMIILPDSLDAGSFRQLRVWLKWKQQM